MAPQTNPEAEFSVDLKEEAILGNDMPKHWYYRAKLAALLRYVTHLHQRKILDVGAGSGFFSKGLLQQTEAQEAVCVDTGYSSNREELVNGKSVQYRGRCEQAEADLVLMMDVLEHVDDDVGLLNEYVRKVPAGAHFLITVPAFYFLWSGHDVFLDHKRRYSLSEVEAVVNRAGLSVELSSYYYGLIFPLAAGTRVISRLFRQHKNDPRSQLKRHRAIINEILAYICSIDLLMLKRNRLAGLTVFCLAQKPCDRSPR
jgi:SAM-dependent methyltransferase